MHAHSERVCATVWVICKYKSFCGQACIRPPTKCLPYSQLIDFNVWGFEVVSGSSWLDLFFASLTILTRPRAFSSWSTPWRCAEREKQSHLNHMHIEVESVLRCHLLAVTACHNKAQYYSCFCTASWTARSMLSIWTLLLCSILLATTPRHRHTLLFIGSNLFGCQFNHSIKRHFTHCNIGAKFLLSRRLFIVASVRFPFIQREQCGQ